MLQKQIDYEFRVVNLHKLRVRDTPFSISLVIFEKEKYNNSKQYR